MCKTIPIKIRLGRTINHNTSADRFVNCVGLPPQIKQNTLISDALVRPTVVSTMSDSGRDCWLLLANSNNSLSAANPQMVGLPLSPPLQIEKLLPSMVFCSIVHLVG